MKTLRIALVLSLAAPAAFAGDGIDIRPGRDETVFGNCVPSLLARNRSGETIGYLQVDLALTLRNGQERTVELKSAYREGVPAPVVPGAQTTLRQHLDTSRAIGVPCGEIAHRKAIATVCLTERGTPCASSVEVKP